MEISNKEAKLAARRSYRSMWPQDRRRRSRHKRTGKFGGTPSSTPGSTKDMNRCRASSWDKFCAKAARARKHLDYQSWLDSHRYR